MPKKKPKKRSRRTSGTTSNTDPASDFYSGTNIFILPNGDTYVGDYCAHRSGLIWREGNGFYQTEDGHIYDGQWKDDKLVDNCPVAINYPNGDTYEGTMSKNKYEKSGVITFKMGPSLFANFQNNKPSGEFYLTDAEGKLWRGITALEQQDLIYCRSEHVFFSHIHPQRGLSKDLLKEVEPCWQESSLKSTVAEEQASLESIVLGDRDREMLVFSKKPRIVSGITWEDSRWYQNFVDYKKHRERVLGKVQKHERLSKAESKWYQQYSISKRHRGMKEVAGGKEVDSSLLGKFYSQEHRESARPYAIFAPTYSWRPHGEEVEEYDTETGDSAESKPLEESQDEMLEEMEAGNIDTNEKDEAVEEEEEDKMDLRKNRRDSACGTRSLYDFVHAATGRIIEKDCESQF